MTTRLASGALRVATVAAWASLMACTAAAAQSAQTLQIRALAATCANCHGTDGHAVRDSAIPPLAGLPAQYIASRMLAFQNGSRAATVMPQIAKGFSAEQIAALAAWFANQK